MDTQQKITITISGAQGSGKSCTADMLREVLCAYGAEVVINDGDRGSISARSFFRPTRIIINVEQK